MKKLMTHLFSAQSAARAGLFFAAWMAPAGLIYGSGEGEGEGGGSPWLDLLYQAVNLLVLVGLIYYFARKPVARFFTSSSAGAREEFQQAHGEAERMAGELEKQREKVKNLEAELAGMKEAAQAGAKNEHKLLMAEAEAGAERIVEQGRAQVEQEMQKARAELREHLADETVRLAEELIRSRMDSGRQRELVADFLRQLESPS